MKNKPLPFNFQLIKNINNLNGPIGNKIKTDCEQNLTCNYSLNINAREKEKTSLGGFEASAPPWLSCEVNS